METQVGGVGGCLFHGAVDVMWKSYQLRGVMRMDVDTAICRSNSQGMIDRCATQDQEIVWCLKGWYGFTKLSIAERVSVHRWRRHIKVPVVHIVTKCKFWTSTDHDLSPFSVGA